MQRSNATKFIPILIILIIVIVAIIGVVSVGKSLFTSNSSDDTTKVEQEVDKGRTTLLNLSDKNSVTMSVRGPIVADEEFQSYAISISPSDRTITTYTGYLDTVKKKKSLDNNTKAYEQFVYALDKANYMKGEVPADDDKNDLRGICATGYVYEYSVVSGDDVVKRLWSSTCKGSPGSLDASIEQLNTLYFDQIPGSKELVPFAGSLRSRFSF